MAENRPHLRAVTPDYVPVTPEFILPGQIEASPYKPMPGLITQIHERRKAIIRNYELQKQFMYGQCSDPGEKLPDGIEYTVGSGYRSRGGQYRQYHGMGTKKDIDA